MRKIVVLIIILILSLLLTDQIFAGPTYVVVPTTPMPTSSPLSGVSSSGGGASGLSPSPSVSPVAGASGQESSAISPEQLTPTPDTTSIQTPQFSAPNSSLPTITIPPTSLTPVPPNISTQKIAAPPVTPTPTPAIIPTNPQIQPDNISSLQNFLTPDDLAYLIGQFIKAQLQRASQLFG